MYHCTAENEYNLIIHIYTNLVAIENPKIHFIRKTPRFQFGGVENSSESQTGL